MKEKRFQEYLCEVLFYVNMRTGLLNSVNINKNQAAANNKIITM